jgi:hypothetical protein
MENMKIITAAGLLFLAIGTNTQANNWYVRPGGAGSGAGTDWNNAWDFGSVAWSSVNAGDTIWVAGGTYTKSVVPTHGGTAANPIYIKRVQATDAVPVAAAGWSSSFDAQVIVAPQGGGAANPAFNGYEPLAFGTANAANYTVWDGRVDSGISFQLSQACVTGQHVSCIDFGEAYAAAGIPSGNITLTNIECLGPYQQAVAAQGYNCYACAIGFDSTSNILITHCRLHECLDCFLVDNAANTIVDHTAIYDILETYYSGSADIGHANIIEVQYLDTGWNPNLTFSYCCFADWDNEGLRAQFNCTGALTVYGCTFWQPSSGSIGWGRVFEADTGASQGLSGYSSSFTVYCYNNTFVNIGTATGNPGVWSQGNQGWSSSSAVTNNIYWNCQSVPSGLNEDYAYSDAGALGLAHGVSGAGATPFVNLAATNFQIVSTIAATYPRNKGIPIANSGNNTFNLDPLGVVRGGDGAWDIGAFEYGSPAANTNPIIQVSPASLSFGQVLQGVTVSNTFTVQNMGGGTLSGTAAVPAPFSVVSGGTYNLGSNQSQIVVVGFSPSTNAAANSQTVTFTGGGGATAAVSGQLIAVLPGLSFAATAGNLTAPMTANSGGYISQSVDVSSEGQTGVTNGGTATYFFNVSTTAQYTISASVLAANSGSKSFWLNIDAPPVDPTMIWDVYPYSTNFQNVLVSWRGTGGPTNDQFNPQIFNLTAGTHKLIIVGREANVELASMAIAPYNSGKPAPPAPPTDLHVVPGP